MKILHISLGFYPAIDLGGPIKVVYEYSQELLKRGHEVIIVCTNRLNKRKKISSYSFTDYVDGVKVYYFNTHMVPGWQGVFGPSFSPDLWRNLNQIIKNVDIVHINGTRGEIFLVAAFLSRLIHKPYVVQPHGDLPLLGRSIWLKRIFDVVFQRRIIDGSSAMIALSRTELQQCLTVGASIENIYIIPNGMKIPNFAKIKMGQFRSNWGFNQKDKIILFLGRINWIKGVDILVRSFSLMNNKAYLVIAGPDDGDLPVIKKLVRECNIQDRTLIIGHLDGNQAIEAIRDTDVFALTSRKDAFPMAVVEAAAVGKPLVISNTCEIGEIFMERGGAIIVPITDEIKIAQELDRLISNEELCNELSEKAKSIALNRFSIEKSCDTLEKMYRQVIIA